MTGSPLRSIYVRAKTSSWRVCVYSNGEVKHRVLIGYLATWRQSQPVDYTNSPLLQFAGEKNFILWDVDSFYRVHFDITFPLLLRDSWLVSIIIRTNPPSLNISDQAEVMCKRLCNENESKKGSVLFELKPGDCRSVVYCVFAIEFIDFLTTSLDG